MSVSNPSICLKPLGISSLHDVGSEPWLCDSQIDEERVWRAAGKSCLLVWSCERTSYIPVVVTL